LEKKKKGFRPGDWRTENFGNPAGLAPGRRHLSIAALFQLKRIVRKYQIEPKELIKESLGRSPNYADALFGGLALGPRRARQSEAGMTLSQVESLFERLHVAPA